VLLTVDIGNSHTTIGVFAGDVLQCEFRLGTRRTWTRDEFAVSLRGSLELAGLRPEQLSDGVLACVVPPVQRAVVEALVQYSKIDPLIVGPGVRTGMPIRYDPPQDVGADRIVTAVAAHARHWMEGHGIIVVDFGTATTFDVISPQPAYLGGVIAPGIGISADALFTRAAKLPRVDTVRPPSVIGRNTVTAIQSGLFHGYLGLVDGLVARIRAEVDWPTRVVATGGFAPLIANESQSLDVVDDMLVLEGLRLIHELNRPHGAAHV
jgi:type III pantothenate kinase